MLSGFSGPGFCRGFFLFYGSFAFFNDLVEFLAFHSFFFKKFLRDFLEKTVVFLKQFDDSLVSFVNDSCNFFINVVLCIFRKLSDQFWFTRSIATSAFSESNILELAGVADVLSKVIGSRTSVNVVYATLAALKEMRTVEEIAKIIVKKSFIF